MKDGLLTLDPIVASGAFIGRSSELDELRAILGGAAPHNCNLVGEPSIGRTSLLYQVYHQQLGAAGQEGIYTWVALSDLPVHTSLAFWEHLRHAFETELRRRGYDLPIVQLDTQEAPDPSDKAWNAFRAVERAIRAVGRASNDPIPRVVFVIDDFDLLMPNLVASDLQGISSLATSFRSYFAFLMSSTESLADVYRRCEQFRGLPSYPLRYFDFMRLSLLSLEDSRDLLSKVLTTLDWNDTGYSLEKAESFLLREVGRHPALLKLGCKHLLVEHKRSSGNHADRFSEENVSFDIRNDSLVNILFDTLLARQSGDHIRSHVLQQLAGGPVEYELTPDERRALRALEQIGLIERRDGKPALFADAFVHHIRVRSTASLESQLATAKSVEWEYIPGRRVVIVEGVERELSSSEYRLLDYLYENRGQVCSRTQIMRDVWGPGKTTAVIEKGINRLRAKVEPDPARPRYLVSVKGEGYVLRCEGANSLQARIPRIQQETNRKAKVKILFLAANPSDTARLGLGREIRAIDEKLRQTPYRDVFQIEQHWAVRVSDLQGLLLRHEPSIVHFSAHGNTESIILEDDSGESRPVSSRALSGLFSVIRDNVRLVVLNACFAEQQATAIAEHIDCVVGMSRAIGELPAISFAEAFYQALGFGRDVKTAFELGCVQIDSERSNEQDIPRLIATKADPKEIVFV